LRKKKQSVGIKLIILKITFDCKNNKNKIIISEFF